MYLNDRAVVNAEIDGVYLRDYPDFCDAHFSYAAYEDGTILTDAELEALTEKYPDVINEMAYEQCVEAADFMRD